MVTFDNAVKLFFANYANFSGRATRAMYWWAQLFTFLVGLVAGIIGAVIGGDTGINVLTGIASLALLLPSLAVAVRRLHDIGKGGGWIFISCIPVVGQIWFLVLMLTDSEHFDNRFGPYYYGGLDI